MAWGERFNNVFFLAEAENAYDALDADERQIVDAAIIKRLSREAYQAALRIYESRQCNRPEILPGIFDAVVEDYIHPDRVTMLRGFMIDMHQKDKVHLARAELSINGNYYHAALLNGEEARGFARRGVCREAFDHARKQLMPMAPVISYVLRALKPDYIDTQMPPRHIEMALAVSA